jgi:hypothetical protein
MLMPHHSLAAAAAAATGQASPESLRTFLEPMDIPEAGRRLHVAVQDMPGWGDDINLVRYLKLVLSYIMEQRAKVGLGVFVCRHRQCIQPMHQPSKVLGKD